MVPPAPRTGGPASAPPPRILVADDDADLRGAVSLRLRRAGYDVEEVGDGVGVIDRVVGDAAAGPHDLILLDVDLPGLTGLDVVAALRCARWTTPVILMTGLPQEAVHPEAEDLGVSDVLAKPLRWEALQAAVRTVVGDPLGAG
ncbi:MAG TPA: response regulator [Candidatus Binatia bacterium]|nr:response regulator [Candidatus Binatia bacterium]